MRQTGDEELVAAIEGLLPEIGAERGLGATFTPALRAKLVAAMPGLKERAKTLVELLDSAYYLYAQRPLKLDEKATGLLADGRARTRRHREKLEAVSDWNAEQRRGRGARPCGDRSAPSSARWRSLCARPSPAGRPRPACSTSWRCSAATSPGPLGDQLSKAA